MDACPALLITAPSSHTGKTTVVAALARLLNQQGMRVRVFKTGPDFIDPTILERASGHPVYQLDLWMVGEGECRRLLHQAAMEADIILIEGVMGMFDGNPSSADLAAKFGLPMLAVIDAAAMAQTFGALAHGLASYRDDINLFGVIANRVGSPGHAQMLQESLRPPLAFCGYLPKSAEIALPERHLGLVLADELTDLDRKLDQAAALLGEHGDIPLPKPVLFDAPGSAALGQPLKQHRIGIARDAAFAFLYPANLALLESLGAELCFFSPLHDPALPDGLDALYLPGGYPELYLTPLSANRTMQAAIRAHIEADKPCLAECGGMLYLLDSLTDKAGRCANMVGALPGHARMQDKLAGLGLQSASLPEGELRGHTFHHSLSEIAQPPLLQASNPRRGRTGEAIYRYKRLTASYVHWYFGSNPDAVVALFRSR